MARRPLRNPRAISPSFAWVHPTRSMVVRQGGPVSPQLVDRSANPLLPKAEINIYKQYLILKTFV